MKNRILWFASNNYGKVKDIAFLLNNYNIKFLEDLPAYNEPDEDGVTFEENAFIKAKALSDIVETWVIGDDSGICVKSLNGFPGIKSKRWAAPETDETKLCELLVAKIQLETDNQNREAYFKTCLVLYNSKLKKRYTFTGICEGVIGDEIMKSNFTFGYDWIFKPKKFNKYFAELDPETKRINSARGIAVKKLVDFLESDDFKYE